MQDFKRHIKEAIALNTQRLPKYAEITDNKSVPFSKRLIKYEQLILLTAYFVDLIGDKYQVKGIPFIKEEFVDMNEIGDFSRNFPSEIDFTIKLSKQDFKPTKKAIKQAISDRSAVQVVSSCQYLLNILQDQPHVYCMTRHLVESIHRIAFLIPLHRKQADQLNIKAPDFYSWLLIKSHILLFDRSQKFDEDVAFIQESGIPFIWQDLPSIDTKNTYTY